MNRRSALVVTLAVGVLLVALPAGAQQTGKVPRIGFLGNSTAALEANLIGPFREGLRDLGYEEGRNVLIEYRWAEGKYERFPKDRRINPGPPARRLIAMALPGVSSPWPSPHNAAYVISRAVL